jgi:hypothetical protein
MWLDCYTKFNLNEKLYFVGFDYLTQKYVCRAVQIKQISVGFVSEVAEEIDITYEVYDAYRKLYYVATCDDLIRDKEEAKKEMRKRNEMIEENEK